MVHLGLSIKYITVYQFKYPPLNLTSKYRTNNVAFKTFMGEQPPTQRMVFYIR